MSGKLSFTINFSEEDEFLLSYLETFPQEQWEGLIKEALQVHSAKGSASKALPKEGNPQNSDLSQWSIEELFVAPPAKESKTAKDPLSHLFALIGEEDDEDVLELLLHPDTKRSEGFVQGSENHKIDFEEYSKENLEDNLDVNKKKDSLKHLMTNPIENPKEIKEEPTSNKDIAGSKGLAFVLNQVIGEEEDPEVLRFFENK